jgi:long-chain fatty acid transport protein
MHRVVRFAISTVGLLATTLGAERPARATSALEIIGAPTGGNPMTARVLSHSSAATYFNPSLLPEATPKLEVGLFGLALQGNVRLQARPDDVDVSKFVYTTPTSAYTTRNDNLWPPLATADLPNPRSDTDAGNNILYAAIGMVRPLAGKSLVFGFHALLPVRGFLDQKGFFVDEREQFFSNQLHFERFGDRLSVYSITFGLGSQLSDWISVGAGVDIAILTESHIVVYVPDALDQRRAMLAPDIHTDSKFKPYFAATVHPTARSSVVATVHMPFVNETNGENDLRFWNKKREDNSVLQTYTISQGNEPLRIAIGGSFTGRRWEDGRVPWEVGIQLLGERWSQYRDRQGEHPLDTWKNTLSCAVGGGFLWRDRHVTADLGYIPSPVPDQTGRTNYVDNSRLVMSLGIEGPVKFLGRDLEAGVTVIGSYFLPREVTKDPYAAHPVLDEFPDDAVDMTTGLPAEGALGLQTNNPGYPGWKSTGYMIGAGATFRIAR